MTQSRELRRISVLTCLSSKLPLQTLNLSSQDLRLMRYVMESGRPAQPYKEEPEWPHQPAEKRLWRVKHLDLSDTHIGDEELSVFAERCGRLETLDLSGTSVTADGVHALIRQCPCLASIDLTGCRGVPIRQRRNVFDFLEE